MAKHEQPTALWKVYSQRVPPSWYYYLQAQFAEEEKKCAQVISRISVEAQKTKRDPRQKKKGRKLGELQAWEFRPPARSANYYCTVQGKTTKSQIYCVGGWEAAITREADRRGMTGLKRHELRCQVKWQPGAVAHESWFFFSGCFRLSACKCTKLESSFSWIYIIIIIILDQFQILSLALSSFAQPQLFSSCFD